MPSCFSVPSLRSPRKGVSVLFRHLSAADDVDALRHATHAPSADENHLSIE